MANFIVRNWATLLIAVSASLIVMLPSPGAARSYASGDAQLVVRRIPTLGRYVGVEFTIDGRNAGTLLYGHTYRTALPSGHHTMVVRGSPRHQYYEPWITTFNIRAGETYTFTAYDAGTQVALRRN
jgi:hypothetical protein